MQYLETFSFPGLPSDFDARRELTGCLPIPTKAGF